MEKEIKNKVVIVTGGAQGIGYEIVDKYLSAEAKIVILLDKNEIKGRQAASVLTAKHGNDKVVFLKCDMTKNLDETSKYIIDTYKKVDVLVNNAGTGDEFSPRMVMETNSLAVIECSMIFWEHMRKDKGGDGGTILNIGSIYSYAVDPYAVFYKASKFSIMGFTRSLGHSDNLEKFGVRVVTLCPGFTTTPLADKQLLWDEHVDDFAKFIETQPWQAAEKVGDAAVEVFKTADSGSAWKVIDGVLTEIPLIREGNHFR